MKVVVASIMRTSLHFLLEMYSDIYQPIIDNYPSYPNMKIMPHYAITNNTTLDL